jgi:hypothetical protein
MATVGYGDIHPATPAGKGLAILLIVLGTGAFLGVFANATELMISRRESLVRRRKLHMIIGLYFSEVGGWLLRGFSKADPERSLLRDRLIVGNGWSAKDFNTVRNKLKKFQFAVAAEKIDLRDLAEKLSEKRGFLIRLLENPALLEQEAFAEHLRAVLHLAEEFPCRRDFDDIQPSDLQHLKGDMKRVYSSLVDHWLSNMEHMKEQYPYLFSLAVRTNPFDEAATPIVSQ